MFSDVADIHGARGNAMKKTILASILVCVTLAGGYSDQWHERADLLWNQAMDSKKRKNYAEAIDFLTRAIVAEGKSGNIRNDEYIMQLRELAEAYGARGDHDSAVKAYGLLRDFTLKIRDRAAQADASMGLARAHVQRSSDDEALKWLAETITLEKELQRQDRLVAAVNQAARVYRKKGDYEKAAEGYSQALVLLDRWGFDENRAALLNNLGTLAFYCGNFTEALAYFSRALELDQKSSLQKHLASDLRNIASMHYALGNHDRALDYYARSMTADRAGGNRLMLAFSLCRTGEIHYYQGRHQQALDAFREALAGIEGVDAAGVRAAIFSGMARADDALANYDRALECYLKALESGASIARDDSMAARLNDIATIYESRGKFDQAFNYYTLALKNREGSLDDVIRAAALRDVGRVLLQQKKYSQAEGYISRALAADRAAGNHDGIIASLAYLGRVRHSQARYEAALELFREATGLLVEVSGSRVSLSENEMDLGRWHIEAAARSGNLDEVLRVHFMMNLCRCAPFLTGDAVNEARKQLKTQSVEAPERGVIIALVNIAWDNPFAVVRTRRETRTLPIDKKAMVKDFFTRYERELSGVPAGVIVAQAGKSSPQKSLDHDLQRIVRLYHSFLEKSDITSADQKLILSLGSDLYRHLFSSSDDMIRTSERIIVLAEDAFTSFPFDTLVDIRGKYLAENHIIIHETMPRTELRGSDGPWELSCVDPKYETAAESGNTERDAERGELRAVYEAMNRRWKVDGGQVLVVPALPQGLAGDERLATLSSLMALAGQRGGALALWPLDDAARKLFMARFSSALSRASTRGVAESLARVKRSFINREMNDEERLIPGDGNVDYRDLVMKMSNPHYWAAYIVNER
jgi:tetratricopeptide (TPR) repeat protein